MGELSEPLPGFFPSCSAGLYLTTSEMVYKLNGYKRKVKVFAAAASYVETPAIINDCNVDHITPKSPLSNPCHVGPNLCAAQKYIIYCRSAPNCL